MYDADPTTRTPTRDRRKTEVETYDARAEHSCPAHRWVEKRRANRPRRPVTRLPAYATTA